MSEQKQINVRMDKEVYDEIAARAAAVGMSVPEYARQVLADEANDLRHRFLAAGAHFVGSWTDTFAEQFGHPAACQDELRGTAA